ncbi:MAG: chromosomal replication initiator protein DnaA [Nitrospirota bacterium]
MEVWNKTLDYLAADLSQQNFTKWIKPLRAREGEAGVVHLDAPDRFFKEWVEERFLGEITQAVALVTDGRMGVELGINGDKRVSVVAPPAPVVRRDDGVSNGEESTMARLRARMTFEEFVVGPSNQFVHAAAQAVANMPGRTYNPFFIYGGSGLGKTHLLNAIAHRVSANNPRLQVCLLTAERFVNELIDHMQRNRWEAFRKRYRKVDLLLIDDIQFIAGKERTQEEFFHTFNALHAQNKQIVLTADCSPKEIESLEERLKTRFEWGLMGDIQAPALETKVAILNKKAALEGMELPEDVALLLASRVHSNVRKLEGCLIKLAAFTSITGQQVDVRLAEQLLRDLLYEERRLLSMEVIQKSVADHYGLKVSDLKSKRRTESISTPRQVAMYLCRTLTSHSLPEIGKVFGGRDHTTVLHGCRKIGEAKERDPGVAQTVRVLTHRLERSDS